ncbi:MAG TPA: glycosyl hydrolase [Dysgonomonas sp.]|nr:glycosyl hydrolase [Dysgonomonas sp.]
MKKNIFLFLSIFCVLLSSCSETNTAVFNGKNTDNWNTSGNVKVDNEMLILTGYGSKAILKDGKYKNFSLSMDIRTVDGGKGEIWFHTDNALDKGYRIAINNDVQDPIWWKMTGSLISVRNLTKSFVKEDEWFTLNIDVKGQSIIVNINGSPVVDYIEPAEPYRVGENKNTVLSEGTFALINNNSGTLEFKNLHLSIIDEKAINKGLQSAEVVNEQTSEIIRLHQEDFPVLDYHVHLKGGLTKEAAAIQSRKTGINYAIAPNCGVGFPITNDAEVISFLDSMRTQPFILAMQAEGREWITTFSPEVRDEFDFVFTDALTFTDNKGRRTRIWIPEETWIEDEQKYMDMLVDKICDVLQEPVDVYVNPCYLPDQMSDRYDEFWTEARMNKFIDALLKSGKALEINELYNIPNKAIIMKAKEAGVKFTFGTNNVVPEVSMLEYSIRMKKECGLTAKDMYKPKIKI